MMAIYGRQALYITLEEDHIMSVYEGISLSSKAISLLSIEESGIKYNVAIILSPLSLIG